MVTQRIALNTATGATLADRAITFAGTDVSAPVISFLDNQAANCIRTVYAAEIPGAATVSFSAGNNTTYSFTINQIINGEKKTSIFSYTSDASGSEAEIDAAFTAALTKLISNGYFQFAFTVAGSSTIVITANAGFPLLQVIAGENVTVGSVTAGANAVNKGADLVAAGVENAVAGNTYTSFEFVTADMSFSAGQERKVWKRLVVYVKTGQTAIAQLTTILNAAGFASGQVELLS
jgi:hypothetical protein